jgi:hypothetical protein
LPIDQVMHMAAGRLTVKDEGIDTGQVVFLNGPVQQIEAIFTGLTAKHLMHDRHNRNAIGAPAPLVDPKQGRMDQFVLQNKIISFTAKRRPEPAREIVQ